MEVRIAYFDLNNRYRKATYDLGQWDPSQLAGWMLGFLPGFEGKIMSITVDRKEC